MKEQIILVEDDPQQSKSIATEIRRRFNNIEVDIVRTESEFYARINSISSHDFKPCLIICDVMLPWVFSDPNTPSMPPDVKEGTFRKAGVRCWTRFRQRDDLQAIPWIYYSVLDDETIEYEIHSDERTGFVQKTNSIYPLLSEIREYINVDDNWTDDDDEVTRNIMSYPKMRKILINGLGAPLSDCATVLS